jgi:hypothetical protein
MIQLASVIDFAIEVRMVIDQALGEGKGQPLVRFVAPSQLNPPPPLSIAERAATHRGKA